jgi:3-hydroxyacyl-[acyl-carrier-protein] dehydratase
MLLNDFFMIDSLQKDNAAAGGSPGPNTTARATLRLNPEHPIFKGHFPGRPVVPGACLLQLVQEMTARITGKEWRLLKGDQIKFIAMIDPRVNKIVEMTVTCKEIAGGDLQVSAELSGTPAGANATPAAVCFKFKGTFRSA